MDEMLVLADEGDGPRIGALHDRGGCELARVALLQRAWRLDARRLRLVLAADLEVRPDLRRIGLGSRLMRAVEEIVRVEGFDGLVVFSSVGPPFFERLGYEELTTHRLEADLEGWREAGPPVADPPAIRDYEPEDFTAVRELFNNAACLQRMAVLRDEMSWRARLAPGADHHFLVSEGAGGVAGYLRASVEEDRGLVRILEYGFEIGAREHLTALLRHLLERVPEDPGQRLVGIVPRRFRNLCPARSTSWRTETSLRLMMKSFGGFQVPVECPEDDRLVWTTDREMSRIGSWRSSPSGWT
ncbi:MAG: GNAT family N-acetyltransferase [Planctomycetota bacterium]|nr:GNAT family N-acetyltransferase [Planctomycetota bacterium]